ncbi:MULTISPECIES: chromosome segregation protein SMC [unclassified Virgibacillus]|uniref:chromosome segregation protein SMC n=1 Tax=unclassified Virgibacillus TaxID=2620237 RepID=UPI00090BBAD4|nr:MULTISPECIES: chromosome segregation protein SMC [unclassified Virgibacillus]API93858.1 chromosome segregation protein SMC [Virgibacillus sp. 6R]MBS7427599.1 chromosome segregation protein SMC [Virgibacillus sp. 19R1-5]
MYLKRLESVGFKSFAKRINVDFVPGVTAVVGPNGSGKSNITDAIRWVLGEQSAKSLRGSKMEDIIFQGSDTRKPLNVAEVTLVLDNHDQLLPLDYDEVSVTRRVYRSGDSEYYINNQSCRLKDIVHLFMDSGLGREAFSIISQGKVEEILSSKAEERRTIFEEAAGVLKYKQRKKKAEYKLAETQENLNRVEDIIHEIEQQIQPLQEQAEIARQYQVFKDQLKETEITYLLAEIERLHTEWQSLLKEIDQLKDKQQSVQHKLDQKEKEQDKERHSLQQMDQQFEQLQADLLTVTQTLEKYEGKKQLFLERSKHFFENKAKLGAQKNQTSVRIGQLHDVFVQEKKHLADLQTAKKATEQSVKQLESKLRLGNADLAEKIEDRKSDYIECLNEQAAKRNEKQTLEERLQQVAAITEKQSEKFAGLIHDREELLEKVKRLTPDVEQQKQTCTQKEKNIQSIKQSLERERHAFQEAQTKLYQGYQYIEKIKSKKEMLEEMKEDFQGFFQGVKAVLKAREEKKLSGVYGAIIELMDVPKAYITAMETVLGGQAQHIVVKDERSARQSISWLKQTNNGRATFLPLSSIQERFIPNDIKRKLIGHAGYVGIAAELIQTDAVYRKAINHLMGHVVIAKTLKDANELAALSSRRYRIVTLDGDVVNPGGSMSGGAKKKTNQSLFTREKELEEMTAKLQAFDTKILEFEKNVQRQKRQIQVLEEQLKTEETTLQAEQKQLQQMQTDFRELEMKLHALNDRLRIYDQDKRQHTEDRDDLANRKMLLEKELIQLDQQAKEIEQEIQDLNKQQTELKNNKEKLQEELHQKQVLLAEQDERVRNQREKTKQVQEQLTELQHEYDQYVEEWKNLVEFQEANESEEQIDDMIRQQSRAKQEITASIEKIRKERTTRSKQIQDQEQELKLIHKQLDELRRTLNQKEVQSNRIDVELENLLNHLQSEYLMTYEKAQQMYEKAKDKQAAQASVTQLKQQIEQLGTVNLGAIDEYERINERYSFLKEQQTDLVEAKQTLHQVISEMDEEMKNRFGETFSQIKEAFADVFQQLFGGGHAELKLTDPKNLLDTGVDIIAQPPGKKLQHLGLLSGGERALTAIALLFAILRVRPVPFCVLDEVEAALDEANVARFAKYVKLFSEKTQFIVITHRKGTMEEADVLYGVTMQESGVSRLVSVRLEDTEQLVEQ